jgi:hypothetical protein
VIDATRFKENQLTTVAIRNNTWLFNFKLNLTENSTPLIDEYFKGFHNISLNSRIYVITENVNNSYNLFEVYRKMSGMNLTVQLLCKQEGPGNVIDLLNTKGIWIRKKNLTGAHLKIGYIPNHSLIYEKDEVLLKFK